MYIIISALVIIATTAGMTGCAQTGSYEKTERAAIKSGMSNYTKKSEELQKLSANQNEIVTMTITPEQSLADLLNVGKLNLTILTFRVSGSEGNSYSSLLYKNGLNEVLTADIWSTGEEVILNAPQFLEKYLVVRSDEVGKLAGTAVKAHNYEIPENMPSEKAVKAVINAAADKYFEIFADAPTEKGVDVEIDGKIENVDKTTIEITGEAIQQIMVAALEQVRENEEIKTFLKEYLEKSELDADVDKLISDAVTDADEYAKAIGGIKMTVYVKGGKIAKRVVEMESNSKGTTTITFTKSETKISVYLVEMLGQKITANLTYGNEKQVTGEILFGNSKAASVVMQWSENTFEEKEVPQLTDDNKVDMVSDDSSQLLGAFISGYMKMAQDFETNGYDLIGYFAFSQLSSLVQQSAGMQAVA
jgi:hypothetical protein